MVDAHIFDSENKDIVELQAMRFAKDFSTLYKLEKKKSEELKSLAGELKERNEELMDIAFLTSNQFLEPIKKIESKFSLIRRNENISPEKLEKLSDEIQSSLEFLVGRVHEMSKFYRINAVRNLARPVSLDEVLSEVLIDLKSMIQGIDGKVQLEALPTLETDRVQLKILFRQLIVFCLPDLNTNKPSVLKVKSIQSARGLWRISLSVKGSDCLNMNFGLNKHERRRGFNRGLDICQRIILRLGGYLYGEVVSDEIFSCHVVLPDKKIPDAFSLNNIAGVF